MVNLQFMPSFSALMVDLNPQIPAKTSAVAITATCCLPLDNIQAYSYRTYLLPF
jgi:hypothetical protein